MSHFEGRHARLHEVRTDRQVRQDQQFARDAISVVARKTQPSSRPIQLAKRREDVAPIAVDQRPLVPEPPPVRLVSIADVRLNVRPAEEPELDRLYVEVLGFERVSGASAGTVFRAENADLIFSVSEPESPRSHLRMIAVEVPSLATIEQRLLERGIEFQWQKSLQPGHDSILLLDPGGNWIEVREKVLFA
jgi:hypothetical protein